MSRALKMLFLLVALSIGFHAIGVTAPAAASAPEAAWAAAQSSSEHPLPGLHVGCHVAAHLFAATTEPPAAVDTTRAALHAVYTFSLHTFEALPATPPPIA